MEKLLAIVLSVGNYINGDTARGQAYGVKLDICTKLVNLKAALPSQGSLMNFLALIAEQQAPELMNLSEEWIGVWAAADISFKQLSTDINQLEIQLNKVDHEFNKTNESELEKGGALFKRLNTILRTNQPVLSQMKQSFKRAEMDLEQLMSKYGEQLGGVDEEDPEEDPSKKFFSTIADFVRAFQVAIDENISKRQEYEKAMKMAADQDAKRAESSQDGKPAKQKRLTANIFGRFHDAQKASTGDVLAAFKLKLASKGCHVGTMLDI
jgi:hypothetical protein